jgi:tyrosyl-tRNA synthetase
MAKPTIEEQVSILMQGTEYGDEALKAAMSDQLRQRLVEVEAAGRPLKVYCGFDPRTSDLHIGHMVPIRKLRQFQELGHEVTFLIGRFTSLIGDPSDKDKLRPILTKAQATENAGTYAEQAYKILDSETTLIRYNDEWLSKLMFEDLIKIAANFTIQQFLARESFRQRWEAEDPIFLHEFFYALMQAYDAYQMKTDVQVGGSDQLFNILTAGRKLMEAMGEKPNIGIILGILPGTDGSIKMSKSIGNHIPLTSSPEDMYGKVMSIPDRAMGEYFRLATSWTPDEINQVERDLAAGVLHPRDAKMRLAKEIVSIYHGEDAGNLAADHFKLVFQEQGLPEDIPDFQCVAGSSIVEIMVDSGFAKSKSEARRLIDQNGVKLGGEVISDQSLVPKLTGPMVLQVGKRKFLNLLPAKP